MQTIALVGPFDPQIKVLMSQMVPDGFVLKEIPTEGELHKLYDANYIILRVLGLNEQVINSIPNLRLIQRWGVGFDKVDIRAAGKRNIPVAITSGMNAIPVSELTVLLILAVYRKLILLYKNVINGKWQKENIASTTYTIDGKTVGLIGLGSVGKQVARKVKAFGADVQYYDARRLSSAEEETWGVKYAELTDLLKMSDVISLHLPLTDETRHLICKETIGLMKSSAVIINTARGAIVKEEDLIEALQQKRIMGAGLDVFEREPPDKNNLLFQMDNVVVTPHIGGSTAEISLNMAKRCIENIIRISKGEELLKVDVVNAQYLQSFS